MVKHPINCSTTHRKLAMIDQNGIYFLCRTCREEHLVSREEINRMWSQFDQQETTLIPNPKLLVPIRRKTRD